MANYNITTYSTGRKTSYKDASDALETKLETVDVSKAILHIDIIERYGSNYEGILIYADEEGVIETKRTYGSGYKVYEDDNFVVGDSPATHDVNTDLGRNGNAGYIVCDGAGDISVEISSDGSSYGDSFTLKANESFDLAELDVDTIRITHSADSAYRIFVK